jgi:hypothetical protein
MEGFHRPHLAALSQEYDFAKFATPRFLSYLHSSVSVVRVANGARFFSDLEACNLVSSNTVNRFPL